jgi:hypothetical protein
MNAGTGLPLGRATAVTSAGNLTGQLVHNDRAQLTRLSQRDIWSRYLVMDGCVAAASWLSANLYLECQTNQQLLRQKFMSSNLVAA